MQKAFLPSALLAPARRATRLHPLAALWTDERGFVLSSELTLLAVLLVIGMLVGLTTMRDQVVQELGDLASAIGQLNQSYSFAAVAAGGFSVAGSQYVDLSDFCETTDTAGSEPACISVREAASDEALQ